MDTILLIVAVVLVGMGLLAGAAIFWRALTGNKPHNNPTDEGRQEVFLNMWPLCAGGLFIGILLLLFLRGCSK